MGDLNYSALAEWAIPSGPPDVLFHLGMKASSPFAKLAVAFHENMERVSALSALPAIVVSRSLRSKNEKRGMPLTRNALAIGIAEVESYSKDVVWTELGIDRLFASVLIGGWTAFEVLASDLWVTAVNRFPLLGIRALDAEPAGTDSEEVSARKSKKLVSVVAQRVLEPDFDLRQSMGDVLADDFPMTKFPLIVNAYKTIFRDESVLNIIRHLDIRSLSAVRHALVHNAGKADDDFLRQVKGDQRFCNSTKNTVIPLNGAVVAQLLAAVRSQASELIKYVDSWCATLGAAD